MTYIITAAAALLITAAYLLAPAHVVQRVRVAAKTVFGAPPIICANMEYNTPTSTNVAALDRVTGKAVFFPTGVSAGADLGMVLMHKLAYNPKRLESKFPFDGNVVLAQEETTTVQPVLEITGQEFATPIIPLILQGTRNSDAVQTSATGATATITAVLGGTFDIGFRNISNVVVTVSAATKTPNVDYFLEANKGLIRFPVVAAGIAAGATVTVTFDKPALTRESYTAFNLLNQAGTLKLFEMDNKNTSVPKAEWTLQGIITADDGGDRDPEQNAKWKLRFAVVGSPTVLRRAS